MSTIILNFDKQVNAEINRFILRNFDKIIFSDLEIEKIIKLMKFDKKNKDGQIKFVLLKDIGKPVYDQSIDLKTIKESFKFLNEFS